MTVWCRAGGALVRGDGDLCNVVAGPTTAGDGAKSVSQTTGPDGGRATCLASGGKRGVYATVAEPSECEQCCVGAGTAPFEMGRAILRTTLDGRAQSARVGLNSLEHPGAKLQSLTGHQAAQTLQAQLRLDNPSAL